MCHLRWRYDPTDWHVAPGRCLQATTPAPRRRVRARRGAEAGRSGWTSSIRSSLDICQSACSRLSGSQNSWARSARRADKAAAAAQRVAALEREAKDADARLRRLYRLVEDGIAEMDSALKDRIVALRAARDGATAALQRAMSGERQTARPNPMLIEQFGQMMRENLTTGDVPFRKAYLGSIVDRIEVDDREVRILGPKGRSGTVCYGEWRAQRWGSQICTGLAPRVGFEPTTSRLTAGCSTAELPRNSQRTRLAS